jgi:hypothetical protein
MVPWIVFYHKKKELLAITLQGTFPGEIRQTIELLAWERGIPSQEISVSMQDRPLRTHSAETRP